MKTLTCRAFASTLELSASGAPPSEVQWMPPGEHTIVPLVDGKPRQVKMRVTPQMAATANTQLQTMLRKAQAGEGDPPYLDMGHDDKERMALPQEISWGGDDAKTGGIRMKLKWLAGGSNALKEGRVCKISPQWEMDPDTLEFAGVTENLGGLVIRSAFKQNAPIMATAQAGTVTVQGIQARTQHVLATAEALAFERKIPLSEALSRVMAGDPGFYEEYRRSVFQGKFSVTVHARNPETTACRVSAESQDLGGQFIGEAQFVAERDGVSLAQAIQHVARTNPQAYAQYRKATVRR
jgi:hypothetical protein